MNHKVVDLENTMAAEELEPEPLDAEEMTKRGYTKKNGLLFDADGSMVRMTKKEVMHKIMDAYVQMAVLEDELHGLIEGLNCTSE